MDEKMQHRLRLRLRRRQWSSRPAVLRLMAMALFSCLQLVERRQVVNVHAFQPAAAGTRAVARVRRGYDDDRDIRPSTSTASHSHSFCPAAVAPFDNRKSRIKLFSISTDMGTSSSSSSSSTEITNVEGESMDDRLIHNPIDGDGGATVNGKSMHMFNGSSTLNGLLQNESSHSQLPSINGDASITHTVDVPLPTENGGYTHTTASRAKISAANKGKVPWNKGKARSEETRALIAAGVRAKNRERFLQKLLDLGLTEEEYERDKKEERRKKDAERRARKTPKGGYRPTNETKQKISTILRDKWARGEMKRGSVHPDKVRRGFTHSDETRAKISASLKKLWAKDPDYRANMVKKSHASNSNEHVKKQISASLKQKWQDPEFRARMLERIQASRKSSGRPHDLSHREKISQAMKKKWQDEEYRQKTLGAIEKRRNQIAISSPPPKKKKVGKKKQKRIPVEQDSVIRIVQPVQAGIHSVTKQNVVKKRKKEVRNEDGSVVVVTKKELQVKHQELDEIIGSDKPADTLVKHEPKNGSIQRLREERRDLYDLLYGEEVSDATALGDENLDTFDPYGLDDF